MDDETLSAWRALLNAHARVTARVESALVEAGLPPLSWYDVLWPLHRAPGRRLRVGALAEQVTLSRTGLTRLLDRVERDGLISRQPAPEDRRGSYVVITAAGSAVLRKMWPV
jgi:DNA-binding MarR family transcriptional regulator